MLGKGRGANKKGRSKRDAQHVRIYRTMMDTAAWRSLTPVEKSALVELYGLYNGMNNGELFLSCREAARRCNINKDTAGKAFKSLEEKGFIRRRAREPARWDLRLARCWILTEYPFPTGSPPTRDFAKWTPVVEKVPSPNSGLNAPETRTTSGREPKISPKLSDSRGQKQPSI